jgi:hypothetical protein
VPVTAQIRDVNNAPLPNVSVLVTLPPGATVSPPTGITDPTGNVVFQVRATVPGTVSIAGTANGVQVQPVTINFTP